MTRLLALDTGSTFAWAFGDLTSPIPQEISSLKLATSSVHDLLGVRLSVFDQWLADHLLAWGITHIILAERFRSRTLGEAATNLGLDGLVRMHAVRRRIGMLCQPEGTVRKETLGRGAGRSEVMKRLANEWCSHRGVVVRNHHEADACVLWVWATQELISTASRENKSERPQHGVAKKQRNKVAQKPRDPRLMEERSEV